MVWGSSNRRQKSSAACHACWWPPAGDQSARRARRASSQCCVDAASLLQRRGHSPRNALRLAQRSKRQQQLMAAGVQAAAREHAKMCDSVSCFPASCSSSHHAGRLLAAARGGVSGRHIVGPRTWCDERSREAGDFHTFSHALLQLLALLQP